MATQTLMLLENPMHGKRRYNPAGFDAYGNPIMVEGFYNPSRRRVRVRRYRRRRNPRALAIPRVLPSEWTHGVDLTDAGSAVGGLAAATMLPGMIVKDAVTTGQKIWKLVLATGFAVGAGFVAKNVSPSAGRAAFTGGVAGVAVQGLSMFTGVKIGEPKLRRRLGETVPVSPATTREGESVSIILP